MKEHKGAENTLEQAADAGCGGVGLGFRSIACKMSGGRGWREGEMVGMVTSQEDLGKSQLIHV